MHLRCLHTCISALALLLATTIVVPATAQPADAAPLTDARAAELHELLTPSADEPWRTIPWMTSVLEAQRVAIERGKPIFIWAMDGHPLGCV